VRIAASAGLFFCLAAAGGVSAQTPSSSRVAIAAQIEKQNYCLRSNGETFLRLTFLLHFKNVAREKLILAENGVAMDGMDLVAFSEQGASQNWPHIAIDTPEVRQKVYPDALPVQGYVVLKPGKSYEAHAIVHIDLLHSKLPEGGLVKPGKYSIAVTFATWLDTNEAAETIRPFWKKWGYLEDGEVTAPRVNFTINSNPTFHDCGYGN
jgi:hypothetical protein